MIALDGSYLEGGGQIIRTSLALSAITGKAFTITSIRKNRKNPGLKAQHLHCIKAIQELCDADIEGCKLGSDRLILIPRALQAKSFSIDIGTAGSITLVLQSILLPMLFLPKKSTITLTGGTDVSWSMPYDYLAELVLPQFCRYANINACIKKRGYYPKGQGIVEVRTTPKNEADHPIRLDDLGKLVYIKGVSHASAELESAKVAERASAAASQILRNAKCPIYIRTEYQQTASVGCGITLWAIFSKDRSEIDFMNPIRLGADCLGEKGVDAEKIGENAAKKLVWEINTNNPVDEYLADNLIPLLGLKGGSITTTKITDHTRTNIHITEQFLDVKFKIKGNTISVDPAVFKS